MPHVLVLQSDERSTHLHLQSLQHMYMIDTALALILSRSTLSAFLLANQERQTDKHDELTTAATGPT